MKRTTVIRFFLVVSVVCAQRRVESISLSTFTNAANAVIQKAKPVVTFFSTFGKNFITALKNADYNDRSVMVQVPGAKSNAAQTSYAIGYDFGFRGAGDAQQPFGFTFDSFGRYRFQPVSAMLYPGFIPDITDPTGQRKMPLSLSDGVAPQLIQSLLAFVLGSKSSAEKAWRPVAYFLTISPETLFFLRMMMLVNSAQRNTVVRNGVAGGKYPSVSDIPYEMMQLIFRLVITPDIQETKKLNDGIGADKSYLWTKVATLSRPSKLLAKFPPFFVDALNVVKPSIAEAEVQEYKDRFNVPLSDIQKAYAQVRTIFPYEKRVEFIKNTILSTFDPKKMNKTDAELYEYMIRQVVVERYRGLKTFITSSATEAQTVSAEAEITDVSVSATFTNQNLVFVDVDRLMNFLSGRIPKIKDFITHVTNSVRKKDFSPGLITYLAGIGSTVDTEFAELQKLTVDLTSARKILASAQSAQDAEPLDVTEDASTEQAISQAIIDKLDAIAQQESVELGSANRKKTKVPFMAYLDIKFWQAMRMMRQTFRGDQGYLYDDSILSVEKAAVQAYAILFRANDDLSYLENLIKSDPRKFLLKDAKGDTVQMSGKEIYKQYTDVERYLLYTSQRLSSYRATLGKMTLEQQRADQQLIALTTDNDNANILFGKMRRALRGYLRQFQFDRRMPRLKKAKRVALGDAVVLGMGDVNVIEVNSDLPADSATIPAPAATPSVAVLAAEQSAQDSPVEQAAVTNTQPVDDPFAVFGSDSSVGSAESDTSSVAEEELDAESGAVLPILDSPFAAKAGDVQVGTDKKVSKKDATLGITPDLYGYPRTVDAFIQEEFAKLVLRCPLFKNFVETKMAKSINGVIGMDVTEILNAAAGLQSDIQTQEDSSFLPDNEFFSAPVSLSVSNKKPSAAEMEALGKSLQEQYGFVEGEENAQADLLEAGQDIADEVVVEDLKSSDFDNLLIAPAQSQISDQSAEDGVGVQNAAAENMSDQQSTEDNSLSGLFDDSADSGALNFGGDAPVDLATENMGDAAQNQPELSVDEQLQAPVAETGSVSGGDPALAGLF